MDNKLLEYHMSKGWVIVIFVYYFLMIIAGVGLILYIIISKIGYIGTQEEIKKYTFIMSILSSAMFTAVRYSQKLYKACIDGRVVIVHDSKIVFIGNILYFILRPIYAVVFTLITVVGLLGGLVFLMNGFECVISERMIYLVAILSAFIGYSIGRFIDLFEIVSIDKVNKIV